MRHWIACLGALVALTATLAGCGGASARFEVVPINRAQGGKVTETPDATSSSEGKTLVNVSLGTEMVTVTPTGVRDNRAGFTITWPGRHKQEVTVATGDSGDFFLGGGDIGVRIRVGAAR